MVVVVVVGVFVAWPPSSRSRSLDPLAPLVPCDLVLIAAVVELSWELAGFLVLLAAASCAGPISTSRRPLCILVGSVVTALVVVDCCWPPPVVLVESRNWSCETNLGLAVVVIAELVVGAKLELIIIETVLGARVVVLLAAANLLVVLVKPPAELITVDRINCWPLVVIVCCCCIAGVVIEVNIAGVC